jgi:hypothetical protein
VLAEAAGRFCGLEGWAFEAEAVGGGQVACMLAQAEGLAFALVGEGYRMSVEAL